MGRWAVLGTLAVAAWPCSGAMGAPAASPQATMPAGDLDLLVRVESPYLAAAVRPAVGGRMVSLIYKSSGRQLLYDDPKWLGLHRELGLGEHFLAFGGGIFDVVNPADGSTSYPGFVQCAAYEAKAVRTPRGRGIQVRCRRGRLEIVRRMVLAAGGPCLEICAAYRNVGDRPIRTAPHLRIELACSKAGDVFITREPGGVFRYGLGGAFEPGRGFVFCRSRSSPEAVVILYRPAEDACQYTARMSDFNLVSLQCRPVMLRPGQVAERRFLLAVVRDQQEVKAFAGRAREFLGGGVSAALDDVALVARRARGRRGGSTPWSCTSTAAGATSTRWRGQKVRRRRSALSTRRPGAGTSWWGSPRAAGTSAAGRRPVPTSGES